MEELREITWAEFEEIKHSMINQAKQLGEEAVTKGWKFPYGSDPSLYFYNAKALIPCLYRQRGRNVGTEEINPLTGNKIFKKPVPKGYKAKKRPYHRTHHLTLDGCPKIVPFETRVKCAFFVYSDTGAKYFTCEHLVGDCPAKE